MIEKQYHKNKSHTEKAVIVGVVKNKHDESNIDEYLDELSFLIETAGGETKKRFIQKLEYPNPRTFVGKGKLDEIREYIKAEDIEMAVFDEDLTPSQIRNIEEVLDCKILDRSHIILDIFAFRARTAYAKTQVELAQYEYILPRLTNMWTHLSKQKGGIGLKGPGETEIETDRRIIRTKITQLKEKLKEIDKQKITQRKSRESMIRISLVGYTNVGKSTIMNMLSKADVFAENKLFATLDTTVRKVVINNIPFLLSDTVGFIRKLPHHLIESFKSTLDELKEADMLIHVVDISHSNFEDHINVVKQTLVDINIIDKPTILVFNKIDAYNYIEKDPLDLTPMQKNNYNLEELKNTWMANTNMPCLFISAKEKVNIDELKNYIYSFLEKINKQKPSNN